MSLAATVSVPSARAFDFDWKAVEQGVPLSALDAFASYSGFAMKELLEVVIPIRTLKHRRQRGEAISVVEAERLARMARIYELTLKVFGDPDKARRWLSRPKHRFDDRSPLSLMRSEPGGRSVEEALIQIDEGMYI